MAANNQLQGIDVSHYQGAVDWKKVKTAGIAFAYAKATEGNTYTDGQVCHDICEWPSTLLSKIANVFFTHSPSGKNGFYMWGF